MKKNTTNHKKNYEAIEDNGFTIDQIFYIAIQLDSSELSDFLEDMANMGVIEPVFGICSDAEEGAYIIQNLFDADKLGFVAKIAVPHRSHFSFGDNGDLRSCRVNPGHRYNYWTYAEDMDTLIAKAIELSNEHKSLEIEQWKLTHQ